MSKKILIADKSITIRSIAESLLRQKGYEVFAAADQDKAMSSLKESPPDMIFLDYSLPSVSLSIFLQTLKSEPELKNVPVVLMFPVSELKKQESLIQKEHLSYLIKPFTPKELLVKTEEFIKESKAQASTPPQTPAKKKSSVELMEEASSKEVDAFFDSLIPEEERPDKTEKVSMPGEEEDLILSTTFAEAPEEEETEDVDKPHDYEWFLSEMKGEGKKPSEKKKSAPSKVTPKSEKTAKKEDEPEPKKLDVEVREMGTSKLKLDKILSKKKEEKEEEEEPVSGYAQFKNETAKVKEDFVKTSKLPMESILPTPKKESTSKIPVPKETPPALDYYKMADEIVAEVSDKLAKELVKKIDKDAVSKLLKEKIENLDFKIS